MRKKLKLIRGGVGPVTLFAQLRGEAVCKRRERSGDTDARWI
jgi:hypothetical protein